MGSCPSSCEEHVPGKHQSVSANACPSQVYALGPEIFGNLSGFGQSQRKDKKISGLISLFMKATIPGTHGML
jgi:hypothetical protein